MLAPLLFNECDVSAIMENQKRSLQNAVAAAAETLASLSDDEVVSSFVNKFDVDIPNLMKDKMTMSEKEIDYDISGDPMRMFFDRSQPFHVKGTAVTVHIPFTGEAIFFRVQPSTYTLSLPRGLVSKGELLIEYAFPNDQPPTDLKGSLDRQVADIKVYLRRLEESATQLRNEMPSIARHAWQQRKSQFAVKSQVVSALGIPRREEKTVPANPPDKASTTTTRRATVNRQWDAFISHASEDKEEIAKPLAEALRAKGLNVWYDEFTLTVGDRLRRKIDDGLAKSRFGVVILSPSFFEKHWPQQELDGLAAREIRGVKVILPIWHNVGHDEVLAYSPTLADRIAARSQTGLDKVVDELIRAMQ
jgi:hypothetical protein